MHDRDISVSPNAVVKYNKKDIALARRWKEKVKRQREAANTAIDKSLLIGAAMMAFSLFAKKSDRLSKGLESVGLGTLNHWADRIGVEMGKK